MSSPQEQRYTHTQGCEVNHMPDGFVVYQEEQEKVHYLNPTAAIVYVLCGEQQIMEAIADYLQSTFSLPEPPLDSVQECVDNLLKEGLIEPCPSPSSEP